MELSAVKDITDSEPEEDPLNSPPTLVSHRQGGTLWIGETGSSSHNGLQLNWRTHSIGPVTMEVFSGSGNLSKALADQHFHTDQVDLAVDPAHDLSKRSVSEALARRAEQQSTFYTHLAPPCNSYSVARLPRLRTAIVIFPLA